MDLARIVRLPLCSAFFVVLASLQGEAASDTTISTNFVRTGQTEAIIAPLTRFGGATTIQAWSGLVETIITGVGRNNVVTTDAFYFFDAANPSSYSLGTVGLRLSFSGCAAADCGQPPWLLSFVKF